MITILISKQICSENLEVLKKVHRTTWKVEEISISYGSTIPAPESNYEFWPFRATFIDGQEKIRIFIRNLSIGFIGEGPEALSNILDYLGIDYEREDIFTNRLMDNYDYIYLNYHF